MAQESLYKIILLGFDTPDQTTPQGRVTMQRLVDVSGVHGDNIIFIPSNITPNDKVNPLDIITKNFNMDESKKDTYYHNIGNSVCITSDTLTATQETRVRRIGRIPGMIVRTGYKHVDLTTLSESQIRQWFNTGTFDEDSRHEECHEDPESADDVLQSILSGAIDEPVSAPKVSTDTAQHDTSTMKNVDVNVGDEGEVILSPYQTPVVDDTITSGAPSDAVSPSVSQTPDDDVLTSLMNESDTSDDMSDDTNMTVPDGDDIDDLLDGLDFDDTPTPDMSTSSTCDTDTVSQVATSERHNEPPQDAPSADDILSSLSFDDTPTMSSHPDTPQVTEPPVQEDRHESSASTTVQTTDGSTVTADDILGSLSANVHTTPADSSHRVDTTTVSNPVSTNNRHEKTTPEEPPTTDDMTADDILASWTMNKNTTPTPPAPPSSSRHIETTPAPATEPHHEPVHSDDHHNTKHVSASAPRNDTKQEMYEKTDYGVEPDDVPSDDYKGASYQEKLDESPEKAMMREREQKLAEEKRRRDNISSNTGDLERPVDADLVDSIARLSESTSAAVEEEYNGDGTRKTYKDYLSREQATEQTVIEKGNRDFGPQLNNSHVSRSAGGHIIMVTSGKGGVGKTLIAAGVASALALSKAKDVSSGVVARASNTWLIESDYTSPQMSVAYQTGDKHLGHLADYLSDRNKTHNMTSSSDLRQLIEENVHIDEETGLRVVACPTIVNNSVDIEHIPLAILMTIQYANSLGDDVIIDHGNLTRAEYSDLDKVLATELAHYVVIVTTAGSSTTAWSVAKMLTSRDESTIRKLAPEQVLVVLNKVTRQQADFVSKSLAPFIIGSTIPPINALREENTRDGDVSLRSMPMNVKKAIITRCGLMLVNKMGYTKYGRYFSTKNIPGSHPQSTKPKNKTFFQKIADMFDRSPR